MCVFLIKNNNFKMYILKIIFLNSQLNLWDTPTYYSLPLFTKVVRNCNFLRWVASYSYFMLMYLKFEGGYSLPLFTKVVRNCHFLWRVANYNYVSMFLKFRNCYTLPHFTKVARNCTFFQELQVIATLCQCTWNLEVATPCHFLLKWQEIATFFQE